MTRQVQNSVSLLVATDTPLLVLLSADFTAMFLVAREGNEARRTVDVALTYCGKQNRQALYNEVLCTAAADRDVPAAGTGIGFRKPQAHSTWEDMMRITKNGHAISSLDDWFMHAPPCNPEIQWQDGHSAKEAARIWLDSQPDPPEAIQALLRSHPDFHDVSFLRAEPEVPLKFDEFRNPRMADIAIHAKDDTGPLAITVEAKADEEFADTIQTYLRNAETAYEANSASRMTDRLQDLCKALFGIHRDDIAELGKLRFQLCTAVAGSLVLAERIECDRAVTIIQVFETGETSRRKLEDNERDFQDFCRRISSGTYQSVQPNQLIGPIYIPGNPLFDKHTRIYLGEVIHCIGTPKP